jgi:hypothetical protein
MKKYLFILPIVMAVLLTSSYAFAKGCGCAICNCADVKSTQCGCQQK